MAEHDRDNLRRTLHPISIGLHGVSQTRRLSSEERAAYVMAQRALTPEVSADSIVSFLDRRGVS